jgi:hypothetical protein
MNPRIDVLTEMRRLFLDGDTLERLLAGRVEPDDAPPGYAEVARVLGAVVTPFDSADLDLEADHVAAARMLVTQRSPVSGRSDGTSNVMHPKGYRLKVVGILVFGTLLGTSGLAAAGVLPDTAQEKLSNVLDRVGISIPTGHPASSVPTGDHPASSGEQISEIATTTNSTGVSKGGEISSIASSGMSQAGEHGSSGAADHGTDAAPVTTPNAGGTSTADTASAGRSGAHTDIADERSNGRSEAGSANGSGPPSVPSSPGSTH